MKCRFWTLKDTYTADDALRGVKPTFSPKEGHTACTRKMVVDLGQFIQTESGDWPTKKSPEGKQMKLSRDLQGAGLSEQWLGWVAHRDNALRCIAEGQELIDAEAASMEDLAHRDTVLRLAQEQELIDAEAVRLEDQKTDSKPVVKREVKREAQAVISLLEPSVNDDEFASPSSKRARAGRAKEEGSSYVTPIDLASAGDDRVAIPHFRSGPGGVVDLSGDSDDEEGLVL